MKKITLLLLFLLTASFGYSQISETFDPVPAEGVWISNPGEPMTTVDVIDATVDFATYGKVGRMISNAAGLPWQNAVLTMTDFSIDVTTTKTITANVYFVGDDPINILGKLTAGISEANKEIGVDHPGTGWSLLTWDFTGIATGEYDKISFFINRDAGGDWNGSDGNTVSREVWIDNITAAQGSAIAPPASELATGATNPIARLTEDYMSFYNGIASPSGDQYVNETGVTFDSFGGGTTIVGDVVLGDGNTAVKYTAHNYSGIGGNSYDVSSMEKLHIDVYYTGAPAEFQLKLESPGGVGGSQVKIIEIAPASGEWLSFDIDLSLFTVANLADLKWIVPVTPGTADIMYFDNIYFWKAPFDIATDANLSDLTVDGSTVVGFTPGVTTYDIELPFGTTVVPTVVGTSAQTSPATAVTTNATSLPGASTVLVTAQDLGTTKTYTVNFTVALPVPTTAPTAAPARNAGDVISIFSNGAYADITLAELPTSWSESTFNPAFDAGGVAVWEMTGEFIGMQTAAGGIDLTEMETLHIDYWTAESNTINVKLVGIGTALEGSQSLGSTVTGSWQSIEIDMSLYTFDLSGVFQLLIDPAGPNTMYVANFYFSKGNTLSIEENELIQFNAYPNPTENGWNIKSMNEAINSIQVYDILGKVVLTMNPNTNEAQIDASGLNTGLYFAKVNSAVGSKTIKLIKK
jgi:hypothetical protein